MTKWFQVILITLAVRVGLFLFAFLIHQNQGSNFFNGWVRWDGPHYISIAMSGYQSSGEPALFIVFYPLYPFLIWLSHFFINDWQIASILIAVLFSFTASIALFELVLLDFTKRTAFLAVWFLNIFPTAFFLQASYTESLFLTLTLLTIYFFRKNQFLRSGIFGALTTITRVNGMLLLPLLLLETKRFGRNIQTFLMLPTGSLIYLSINYFTFGSPFYFLEPLSKNWFKKTELPWIGIKNLISAIPGYQNSNFYIYFSELVAIIFIIVMTFIVYFKIRKSYAMYMFLNLLLFTSTSYILSTPRYALSLFPIFIALGIIKSQKILALTSVIFISLLLSLTYLYTQGRWAF